MGTLLAVRWLLAFFVATSLLASCAADPSDITSSTAGETALLPSSSRPAATSAQPPSTPPPTSVWPPVLADPVPLSADTLGLTATLQQYREDEVAGRISITVTNDSDDMIVVETLRLAWPGLVDTEPASLDYTVAPGVRVALKAPLGRSVCSSPPQIDERVPVAPIAAVAETSLGEVAFPVTDPLGILDRIHPRACRAQAVEHAVSVTFDDEFTDEFAERADEPAELTGVLRVERRAVTADVTLLDIHGSVLLTVGVDGGPFVLPAGEDVLEVPIVVSNNRCDSHALGEAKKAYVFVVDLVLGEQSVTYAVEPSEAGKGALFGGIIARCPPDTDP